MANSRAIHLTQPQKEKARIEKPAGLPVTGRPPALKFVYCHYPQSWAFVDGFGFLPNLAKIVAKPGVNGVPASGDLSRVLASVHAKGGTYIDPKDPRLGDYMDYVQYYETRAGGKWFVDFCTVATVLPTDEILWSLSEPRAFDKFRAAIRDSGILQPMIVQIYQKLMQMEQRRLEVIAAKMSGNPVKTEQYHKMQKRIEAMREAWEKISGGKVKKAKKIKPAAKKIAARVEL